MAKVDVKCSVQIEAADQMAEILSIRERDSGDLLISLKRNNYFRAINGEYRKITQSKFSVHMSPSSRLPGHTITQELRVTDGEPITCRSFVNCATNPLLWHLCTIRFADLSDPTFKAKPVKKGAITVIDSFDPKFS